MGGDCGGIWLAREGESEGKEGKGVEGRSGMGFLALHLKKALSREGIQRTPGAHQTRAINR